jgi:hypothetical protein
LKRRIVIRIFSIWTLIKWSEQYILDARNIFLYFECHTKSLKQLHIIVCFCVLSVSSSFTISTYFINEGTWKKFQEKNNIGYMYKQWFKNKVKHTQRAHYICVDLEINGYYFLHGERALELPVKCTWDFFFAFARIICYLEYI